MNTNAVLERGVAIIADVRQSHGIKAALSVLHLHERFPQWTDAFWQRALTQARWSEELVVDRPVSIPDREITPERARVLLERTVVPRAYAAVRAWAAARGAEDIINFYLEQAAADPDYLGHRLSILLALREAAPLYMGSEHRDLFLDRLTEFILACRFTATNGGAPLPVTATTWDQACLAALRRPGFFGHHPICLAWIGRSRVSLSEPQFLAALHWMVEAAGTTYADEEDNIAIHPDAAAEMTEPDLEAALQDLLLRGVRNIHLLTLADAIAWLWDNLGQDARPYLAALARHHVKGDAA